MKNSLNRGQFPLLFFWCDNTGNELDCLIEDALGIKCVELNPPQLFILTFFKGLYFYKNLSNLEEGNFYLVYAGNRNVRRKEANVLSWENTREIL